MAKSRLIGDYPVIGIRPTIDGRRGKIKVRESLEEQTMNMAKAAKKLLEENIRYSNGEPVKVVIADTTIGRVAEAAACADKFKKCGVDITLTVTPCWCYGAETMDMDPMTIKAVWGFNGTERPGCMAAPTPPMSFCSRTMFRSTPRKVFSVLPRRLPLWRAASAISPVSIPSRIPIPPFRRLRSI